jgi:hypothetical protein
MSPNSKGELKRNANALLEPPEIFGRHFFEAARGSR